MHRCLYITEIAIHIAEACYPDYKEASFWSEQDHHDRTEFSTLSALARTCRTLQKPALDILWYYQPGLHNLLNCLPEYIRSPRANGGSSQIPVMTVDRVAGDWERFDFYACRVRKFYCHTNRSPGRTEFTSAEYDALRAFRGGPLLPNVQMIIYTPESLTASARIPRLTSLLTTTVTSLYTSCVRVEGGQQLFESLSALPWRAPSLEKLHVELPLSVLNHPAFMPLLRNFNNLHELRLTVNSDILVDVVHTRLLTQLASLPALAGLEFIGASYGRDHEIHAPIQSPHMATTLPSYVSNGESPRGTPIEFSSVDTFYLAAKDGHSTNRILEECSFPSVRHLTLSCDADGLKPASISSLTSILRSRVAAGFLENITIHAHDHLPWRHVAMNEEDGDQARESVVEVSSALSPLQDLHALRYLSFYAGFAISMDDKILERLARSWRNLRALNIVGDRGEIDLAKPTFKGVAEVVKHCPYIEEISLVISDPAEIPDGVDDLPVCRNAVLLDFAHSEADDPTFTATWIAKMFPNVSDLNNIIKNSRYGDDECALPLVYSQRELEEETRRRKKWVEVFKIVNKKLGKRR